MYSIRIIGACRSSVFYCFNNRTTNSGVIVLSIKCIVLYKNIEMTYFVKNQLKAHLTSSYTHYNIMVVWIRGGKNRMILMQMTRLFMFWEGLPKKLVRRCKHYNISYRVVGFSTRVVNKNVHLFNFWFG
jgi:hypothetical protein